MKKDKKLDLSIRDLEIIQNAAYFTTFRFNGPFDRDRREFPSLIEARTDAGDDPRALVYAVCAMEMTAHVPRDYVA